MRAARFAAVVTVAVVIAALGFVGVAGAAPKATIHVGSGESIQDAIDSANPGDTIDVAPGTYTEALTISKDGIRIVGHDATLMGPEFVGIVVADADFNCGCDQPPINHIVTGVSITGFTITGFGTGILVYGASKATLRNDTATDNFEYGYFANSSSGTSFVNDLATGSGEAGFYIGDSPDADASLSKIEAAGNGFGIFVRDAEGVRIIQADSHDNCVGLLVLADAPGPAGNVDAYASSFSDNTKACPASEDSPNVSGIGVALAGANDVRLAGNTIQGNVPAPDFTPDVPPAGVDLFDGDFGTPPENIGIHGNHMGGNAQDILDASSGSNIDISGNH